MDGGVTYMPGCTREENVNDPVRYRRGYKGAWEFEPSKNPDTELLKSIDFDMDMEQGCE